MFVSLIICTYQRKEALLRLLDSVQNQSLYPNQILVIDGSLDSETEIALKDLVYPKLSYYKVDKNNRGLTKQRNFGIEKLNSDSEIVCFLDDDTILDSKYFQNLIETYNICPDALGVGGHITNEVYWEKSNSKVTSNKYFFYDGWYRKEPLRFQLRKIFGLLYDLPPCIMPLSGHGRTNGFLPPSGKIYPVEVFMGGVSSFKIEILKKIRFSSYFQGYGLYEDTDFTLRVSKIGQLYVNTNAKLEHYHHESGRPNKFTYGKMVVLNGWYVWRVKYSKPNFSSKLEWNLITLLLIIIRLSNILTEQKKIEALTESTGRIIGWLLLSFNKPKIKNGHTKKDL